MGRYSWIPWIAILLLVSAPLGAEDCDLDDRPGATLLLPYFEVDLARADGLTTFFTVHNASPRRVLARVVLWTDAAYPTLGFEIDLTGYDLQAINLRDVFGGRLPRTGEGARPPSCVTALPPAEDFMARLEAAHTGTPVTDLGGRCAGFDHGDRVARGYVTVDVVSTCTDLMPSDPGYFGTVGVAGYSNVLWGDFLYFDPSTGRSEGDLLVGLETDPAYGAGDLTFYGRYVDYSGADRREPLPTLWANRYLGGGGLQIASRSIVWRDTGAAPEAFDCAGTPSWWPLEFTEILSFDEQENAVFLTTDVVFVQPPEPPFPAATQQGIGFRAWPFGWEILDLNPAPDRRLQSLVMEIVEAAGGASYLRRAAPLDAGCSVAGCAFGAIEVGLFCLVGDLEPGAPIRFQASPLGCFSSSCTIAYRRLCKAERTAEGLDVEASFCLRDVSEGRTCTDDCGGGGLVECAFDAGLPEGDHTLRLGGFEIEISVPSEVPPNGLCVVTNE